MAVWQTGIEADCLLSSDKSTYLLQYAHHIQDANASGTENYKATHAITLMEMSWAKSILQKVLNYDIQSVTEAAFNLNTLKFHEGCPGPVKTHFCFRQLYVATQTR